MSEQYPPWKLVPEMDPDDPEHHGVGEAYLLIDWLRFWQLLKPDQQAEYLDRWQASPAWRKAIAERYDQYPAEIDRVALRALTRGDTEEAAASPKRRWQFWRRSARRLQQ